MVKMVSDDLSVVIGIWSDVTGVDSVVIGNDSVVIDIASVVIGIDSVVIGIDSVVIGIDSVVGNDSVVIGTDSVVIGIINSVVWNSFVFHAVVTGGVFFCRRCRLVPTFGDLGCNHIGCERFRVVIYTDMFIL
jgi:hypothetical protein